MKKTRKIALGGIIAALSLAVMLTAYFPFLTLALPALAGMFLLVIVEEMGVKWALLVYAAVALLSMLLCEKEAAVMYVFLFGLYPVFKGILDRLRPRVVRILVKFVCLNAAAALGYLLVIWVFQVPVDQMGMVGEYGSLVLLGMLNIAFGPYDYCLSSVLVWYRCRMRSKLLRLLR